MTAQEVAVLRDKVARARLERSGERAREILAELAEQFRETPADKKVYAARYETVAEREAARKRTWRESKRRPCSQCGGTMSHPSAKTCWDCYRDRRAPEHGTITMYVGTSKRPGCRCDQCREAATMYHRDRRARMREWQAAA